MPGKAWEVPGLFTGKFQVMLTIYKLSENNFL